IAAIGVAHGHFLLKGGEREKGLAVLKRSAEAFAKLGRAEEEKQVNDLIEQVRKAEKKTE
ncbi:MAG: hypothetical protein GY753_20205, partial [Gammaproteobacteria bacterium]|nr:hypothetical protein [Gammaproteobacteria bacterium]